MIQFDDSSPIYLQVADFMIEKILTDQWQESDRIPSIREVAALVQVNPNTVMRAYSHLQDNDILFNKRGVGYFVSEQGKQQVQQLKRSAFLSDRLPKLFREAALLGLTAEELSERYTQFLKDDNHVSD